MSLLDGPRLKLRRAEEHLNTLQTVIKRFLESNPYSFVLKPDPQPPQYVLCAKINQSPPIQWSCIVGDFAHNARSALDLLVYQCPNTLLLEDKKRRYLQFPICDCPSDYPDTEKRQLAGIKVTHRAIIEGYQPYKRSKVPTNDALALLRDINDIDKHRLVIMVGAIANLDFFIFDGSSGLPDNLKFEQGARIRVVQHFDFGNGFTGTKVGNGAITKDGVIVAKLTIPQPEKMKVNPDFKITIQFNVADQRIQSRTVVDTLTFIYDRVKEVIRDFEPLFK